MLATFLNIGPDSAVFAFKCVNGRGSLIVRLLGVMVSETFHTGKEWDAGAGRRSRTTGPALFNFPLQARRRGPFGLNTYYPRPDKKETTTSPGQAQLRA